MKTKQSNLCCIGILALGSTAMLGHIINSKPLKSIDLATCTAPYTKVFCNAQTADTNKHFEPFAAEFKLRYKYAGRWQQLEITPEIYQRLEGSYNRRNVYGAVIAFGPALPKDLRVPLLDYALKTPGNVAKELGLPTPLENYEILTYRKNVDSPEPYSMKGK